MLALEQAGVGTRFDVQSQAAADETQRSTQFLSQRIPRRQLATRQAWLSQSMSSRRPCGNSGSLELRSKTVLVKTVLN